MAIGLMYYTIVIPIEVIRKKHPNGWDGWLSEHIGKPIWFDEHLFAISTMDAASVKSILKNLASSGFTPTIKRNGNTVWNDCWVEGVRIFV